MAIGSAGKSTPVPLLDRRPEARELSIEDLIRDVLDGKLRVPPLQHALQWTVNDARELLDSIYRGYPIGTLLLWQQPAEAAAIRHGSVVVNAPAMNDAWWVVDGQQRIHSLVQVLAGADRDDDDFALHFDLERDEFVHLGRNEQVERHHLPLRHVLDPEKLSGWLRERGPAVDDRRAIRLGKRLRDYQIPIYVVRTPDEAVVREIYRRLTATGHRMADSEVFGAIRAARAGRRPEGLLELSRSLVDLGFGVIEDDLLLRMLRAMLGPDVVEPGPPQRESEQAPAQLAALERAARTAILFLRQDAAIPHRSVLPHDLPLVALTAFFGRFPDVHPRSRELLARWVWRGAVIEAHHTGALDVRRTLQIIVGDGDEHAAVQALLASLPGRISEPPRSQPFALDSPRGKLAVLAMLDLEPRDLESGVRVSIESGVEGVLRPMLLDVPEDQQHDLANQILHPPVAGRIRDAVLRVKDPAILTSHAISRSGQEKLAQGHVAAFLRDRGAALRTQVAEFAERRARWELADRPPIAALEIEDED